MCLRYMKRANVARRVFAPRLNLIIERAHYSANVNSGAFETPLQLIVCPEN